MLRRRPEDGSPSPVPPDYGWGFSLNAMHLPIHKVSYLAEALLNRKAPMFTPEQYRAKAAEYTELAKQGNAPDEVREFHTHEQSLTMLADNKQWLADNDDKLADDSDKVVNLPERSVASEATLAAEEAHILRCLGQR